MSNFAQDNSPFNVPYLDDQADPNDPLGPQQSRKPQLPTSSDGPTPRQPPYNPASLLNPHASRPIAAPEVENDQQDDFGAGNMIANLHNLTDRADVPMSKKRKSPAAANEELDPEHKKPKATFHRAGQGGVISEHLKQQNRTESTQGQGQAAGPIDLTADDDEVVLVSETNNPAVPAGSPNEDVCLGRLQSSANVFRLPSPRKAAAVSKDFWPAMTLMFRKDNPSPQNIIIDLYDPAKSKFGTLEPRTASAISQLLAGTYMSKFRCTMALHGRRKLDDDYPGKRVSQSMGLDITLYAARDKAEQIGRFLSQKMLFLTDPLASGGKAVVNPQKPYGFAQNMRPQATKTVTYVTRTAEEMRSEASSMFEKIGKDDDLPMLEANTAIIKTQLLDHQKKGLSFMVDHERANIDVATDSESSKHSLWKFQKDVNGRPSWYHVITNHETKEKPQEIQGGILADVMGLGKTLSILALIAETRDESRRFRRNGKMPEDEDVQCNAKATLIICPKSVLSNWKEQIETHCVPGNLRCYMYHGSNRSQDLDDLAKHDIVLTSYNTAAAEFGEGKKNRALASINWFRIVLDEAHSIRTQTTQISKACCALNAERRWAVTGTPVQNSLNDLGTLIKFLRIKPFDDSHNWTQHIMAKFKLADATVVEQLQLLVGSVTLRRSKNTIGLGDRKEERQHLDWTAEEYHLYSQFAKMSRTHFHNITGGGSAIKGKAYAHVLKSISRLRAICAHGREMLTEEDMEEIKGGDASTAIVLDIGDESDSSDAFDGFIAEKQAYETFTTMQDSEVDSCIKCGEKLGKKEDDAAKLAAQEAEDDYSSEDEEPELKPKQDLLGHLTPCYHLICSECTAKHKAGVESSMTADKHHFCPHCESYVRYGLYPILRSTLQRFIDNRKAARKIKAAKWDEDSYSGPHTKVRALLGALQESADETAALPPGEPPIRSVVFSGWTSYLDLIEFALERNKIGFVRLDGTMSVKQRTQALLTFKEDPKVTVLVASIKAAGQGLNLTSANMVYVMEPQFNPGVEQQAVDRVHRLGQTRPVRIVHYIMKPSVEEGIIKLQHKKTKLAALSMERKRSKAEEVAERLQDVKDLFK